MIFILLILASFFTLTVKIDDKHVIIKFWYWIYSTKFSLEKIESEKRVKNHWFCWWGIRFWFWPNMKIYNVSGFDAVELTMKNWNIYRIGTDEPKKLEKAISKLI